MRPKRPQPHQLKRIAKDELPIYMTTIRITIIIVGLLQNEDSSAYIKQVYLQQAVNFVKIQRRDVAST